jgi:hypothetical protein
MAVMNFTAISLHGGHTIVLMDKWTPEGTLERIEKYRVTHSHMVPKISNDQSPDCDDGVIRGIPVPLKACSLDPVGVMGPLVVDEEERGCE